MITDISIKYTTQVNEHLLKDYYGQELGHYGSNNSMMGNTWPTLWSKSSRVTAGRTGPIWYF